VSASQIDVSGAAFVPICLKAHGSGLLVRVGRSHRRCRPQARRFNPAGFPFGFGGFGKLLLLRLASGRHKRSRSTKSGGPPPLEPSLKIQGDIAHYQSSGFAVAPRVKGLNAHGPLKVPSKMASALGADAEMGWLGSALRRGAGSTKNNHCAPTDLNSRTFDLRH
jgi:hypothetical protein